jgi:hypothetical protein
MVAKGPLGVDQHACRVIAPMIRSRPSPPPSPLDRPSTADHAHSRDLLRTHSKKVASLLALLALGLFVASFALGARRGLPTIAFDWLFGLQVVRAAVAFAIIAVLGVVIIRGWGGLWPQRITTTGIEFATGEREITEGTADVLQTLRDLVREELESKNPKEVEIRE